MLTKIFIHLRRRFLDAPRGFGHPVPAAAFDAEFRSGHWQLLDSPNEDHRYTAIAELVRSSHHRPRLLDAGCGSSRLLLSFSHGELACYDGVDLSSEAIQRARELVPVGSRLEQGDLESWNPTTRYDVIVINEVIGYFHDPAVTVARLARHLLPNGVFVVSLYRWGNALAMWHRLATRFRTLRAVTVTNADGEKTWDIRILAPRIAP